MLLNRPHQDVFEVKQPQVQLGIVLKMARKQLSNQEDNIGWLSINTNGYLSKRVVHREYKSFSQRLVTVVVLGFFRNSSKPYD